MPLTIIDCKVTTNSIQITFSDTIISKKDATNVYPTSNGGWRTASQSALNPANYLISDPHSKDFAGPTDLSNFVPAASNAGAGYEPGSPIVPPTSMMLPTSLSPASWAWIALDESRTKVTINFLVLPLASTPAGASGPEFASDSWVNVVAQNIKGTGESGDKNPVLEGGFALVVRQVPPSKPGVARKVRDIEDAISYPLLTEEVGYPPSPLARPTGGGGFGGGGSGAQGLGQVASAAIGDVLGWKANSADAKGFVSALTQSFTLTEVEGRIESKWNPKSYTVQTDLAGGITGAQASLYTRAQVAQEKCLPLLDGLYALDPRADPEYVKALREIAKSQITEIVKQFGVVPPSILRVNTYFHILLGADRKTLAQGYDAASGEKIVETNPDLVGGTLGDIRKIYGIWFMKDGKDNPLSNSVEDEQNITNFRVVSDYMTSLLLTWLGNYEYFKLTMGKAPAFLGTQLILIGRQFNVIAETVNEVRFTLDSVFIGPNERQQLLLIFADGYEIPSMYLEDVLVEIEKTVTDEGPRLIKDGGRIALNNNLLPVLQTLMNMIEGAHDPVNIGELPDGFRTARVRHSLDDLRDQLTYLYSLAQQVGMQVPQPWQQ
jgi:hypothetical protein